MKRTTTREMAPEIAKRSGVSLEDVQAVLDAVDDVIGDRIVLGERIQFNGLGTFYIEVRNKTRKNIPGRGIVLVPDRYAVDFNMAAGLKRKFAGLPPLGQETEHFDEITGDEQIITPPLGTPWGLPDMAEVIQGAKDRANQRDENQAAGTRPGPVDNPNSGWEDQHPILAGPNLEGKALDAESDGPNLEGKAYSKALDDESDDIPYSQQGVKGHIKDSDNAFVATNQKPADAAPEPTVDQEKDVHAKALTGKEAVKPALPGYDIKQASGNKKS